jgi:hypothetical protein
MCLLLAAACCCLLLQACELNLNSLKLNSNFAVKCSRILAVHFQARGVTGFLLNG